MQEFLLYSQIPAARLDQVLNILAGVTASQPTEFRQHHLVYEQLKTPPPQKGQAAQGQRRNYHQLTRDLSNSDGAESSWKLRTTEVPEPGIKNVISRSVSENPTTSESLERFRPNSEWYKLSNQYTVHGNRFVNGNVIIRIFRIHVGTQPQSEDPLESEPPSGEALKVLDPSGAYVVEACVRTEDGSGSVIRDKATEELLGFAESVKGAIDLRVPDRLALDPRVKGP